MQDNWVQPPPPQALRCLSVNSNAPDCEYTEQNLLWNKDSLSSAIWCLWFGDTDGGRTKAIWGEIGRGARLSHVPHNGTVVSSDPLWTARAQSPKLHGQALAPTSTAAGTKGGHLGSKAQHLMSLIRKQTAKLPSSRLACSKLSQRALMLYIKCCAERNVVLGVHCTTPAPCTLLLTQGLHSPEEFSSLRSKTSQECVKTGVPIKLWVQS